MNEERTCKSCKYFSYTDNKGNWGNCIGLQSISHANFVCDNYLKNPKYIDKGNPPVPNYG